MGGQPTGTTLPHSSGAGLDAAVSGARVEQLKPQVQHLIQKLGSHEYKHVHDKWKLMTIFIGANNICGSCNSSHEWISGEWYESHLRDTLEDIRTNIPKVHVQLVGLFNISKVWGAATDQSNYCIKEIPHLDECECLASHSAKDLEAMDSATAEYNERMQKIATDYDAQGLDDFNVVFQPAFVNIDIKQWGEEYLSYFDCFHPNLCANRFMAIALWNNMWQAPESKASSALPS